MCPLRVILIFLSATLAGFFVIRGLRYQTDCDDGDLATDAAITGDAKSGNRASSSCSEKIAAGFWTLVDMASGRYLWRNLVATTTSSSQPTPTAADAVVAHEKRQ